MKNVRETINLWIAPSLLIKSVPSAVLPLSYTIPVTTSSLEQRFPCDYVGIKSVKVTLLWQREARHLRATVVAER